MQRSNPEHFHRVKAGWRSAAYQWLIVAELDQQERGGDVVGCHCEEGAREIAAREGRLLLEGSRISDPASRARELFGWLGGRLIDTATEGTAAERYGARFLVVTWRESGPLRLYARESVIGRGATAEECVGNGIYRGNTDPRARLTERERAYLERPVPSIQSAR